MVRIEVIFHIFLQMYYRTVLMAHSIYIYRPQYRDNARPKLGQNYRSLGEQFLLLPEPIRYLTDRLVSVNTAVPPVETVVQVSSRELLVALDKVFKLDVFTIS